MLVLSRKTDQTIKVSGPCTIVINQIKGSRVSIGVIAEPEVKILRGEINVREETDQPTDQGRRLDGRGGNPLVHGATETGSGQGE